MADLLRAPLLRLVAAVTLLYAIAAALVPATALILITNDLLLAAAVGVCIAYAPVLPGALTSPRPTKGHVLGSGIFVVSACMLLLRIVSTAARDFGLAEVYNTWIIPAAYTLGILGALMHLLAPGIEDGRVPPERWVKTGIVAAIGVFLAMLCWSVHGALSAPPVVTLR